MAARDVHGLHAALLELHVSSCIISQAIRPWRRHQTSTYNPITHYFTAMPHAVTVLHVGSLQHSSSLDGPLHDAIPWLQISTFPFCLHLGAWRHFSACPQYAVFSCPGFDILTLAGVRGNDMKIVRCLRPLNLHHRGNGGINLDWQRNRPTQPGRNYAAITFSASIIA